MKKMILGIFVFTMMLTSTAFAKEYDIELLQQGEFPEYYEFIYDYEDLQEEIADKLKSRSEKIEVNYNNSDELALIYENTVNNEPTLSYVLDNVEITETENGLTIYPSYEEKVSLFSSKMNNEVNNILECVTDEMTDTEKCLAVHDYIVSHYEYDLSYSIYSYDEFFENRRGVCQAYAEAYKYIMDKLGIKCILVISRQMNHAWNMVRIDGEWYHIDATWDDPVSDKFGRSNHEYFLLSDDAISDEYHRHYGWTSKYDADSKKYDDYFWVDVEHPIHYNNGEWYYYQKYYKVGDNFINLRKFRKYNFKTSKITDLESKINIDIDYFDDGLVIKDNYAYILLYNYYTTDLIKYNLETSEYKLIESFDAYKNQYGEISAGVRFEGDDLVVYIQETKLDFSDSNIDEYYKEKESNVRVVDNYQESSFIYVNKEIKNGSFEVTVTNADEFDEIYYSVKRNLEDLYFPSSDDMKYEGTLNIKNVGENILCIMGIKEGKSSCVKVIPFVNVYNEPFGKIDMSMLTVTEIENGKLLNGRLRIYYNEEFEKLENFNHTVSVIGCYKNDRLESAYIGDPMLSDKGSLYEYIIDDLVITDDTEIKAFIWECSKYNRNIAEVMIPYAVPMNIKI